MDFAHYADDAMQLVNAEVGSVDLLRAWLADRAWLAEAVRPQDVGRLGRAQQELGLVVDASARGDGADVVARLNHLLAEHPIHPRISGHDTEDWHLHVSDEGAAVADVLWSEALFGLTLVVTERGPDRFGRCEAAGCGDAFVDLSRNRTKKYCSARCATRTNVAAHRQRQQRAAASA